MNLIRCLRTVTPVIASLIFAVANASAVDLSIQTPPWVNAGQTVTVAIVADQVDFDLSAFDMTLVLDQASYFPANVERGSHLVNCDWEYFNYRVYGSDTVAAYGLTEGTHLLRLSGIAAVSAGHSPLCYGGTGTLELARIDLQVARINRVNNVDCRYLPLRFMWRTCSDNVLRDDGLGEIHVASSVTDLPSAPVLSFPGLGAPGNACDTITGLTPIADIVANNSGLDMNCLGPTLLRGDLNLNGVPYEMADLVLYQMYFHHGLSVFTINVEAQIAASDTNCDGLPLSVADYIYMLRVVLGEADPCY